MKLVYCVIYTILIIFLLGCSLLAKRSSKPSRGSVAWLDTTIILPLIGCFIMMLSESKTAAFVGCYIYFIGLDLTLLSLVNFTNVYCTGIGDGTQKPTVMYIALLADSVQLLLNVFFGHAFTIESVTVDGEEYFKVIPYFGQTIHRIVDYFVLLCVLLIFTIASVKTPKVYREKYTILLFCLLLLGSLQAYFIFSKSNFDRSVIGYSLFGVVIFYFAIIYRPLRLLDQMLSSIVSDLSDAFYVLDLTGSCVWANDQGCELVGFSGTNYEEINPLLENLFGTIPDNDTEDNKRTLGEGNDIRFFMLEKSW